VIGSGNPANGNIAIKGEGVHQDHDRECQQLLSQRRLALTGDGFRTVGRRFYASAQGRSCCAPIDLRSNGRWI
jgi:hypothetical protein